MKLNNLLCKLSFHKLKRCRKCEWAKLSLEEMMERLKPLVASLAILGTVMELTRNIEKQMGEETNDK